MDVSLYDDGRPRNFREVEPDIQTNRQGVRGAPRITSITNRMKKRPYCFKLIQEDTKNVNISVNDLKKQNSRFFANTL